MTRFLAGAVFLWMSCAAHANVRVFLARAGEEALVEFTGATTITMSPGETARIEAWIEDTSQVHQLMFFQVAVAWVGDPQEGAEGSVSYVDLQPAPGDSVIVDDDHPEWVFTDAEVMPSFYVEIPPPSTWHGAAWISLLQNPSMGIEVVGFRYLGEFRITASPDAAGEHVLLMREHGQGPANGTFFRGPTDTEFNVDEFQDLRIVIDTMCGGYADVNGDGTVNLDDVLCALDAFADVGTACAQADLDIGPGCEEDGFVDLHDIVAVLDVFAGASACCP